MRKLSRNVQINVAPERVFEFLTVPDNFLIVWPSMVEVANVQLKADGGHTFDWVYKMAGMRFHGRADTIQIQKPRLIVSKNEGGIPSTFRWSIEPKGSGSLLSLDVEYEIPTPILGKIAEAVVAKMNEHEIEMLLSNIQHNVESVGKPLTPPSPRANASTQR